MEDKIKPLDPRVQKPIRTYLEVFAELTPPASCDKLVQTDLKLKPEFMGPRISRRLYPAPKEQADEIERQIQECIDAGLVLENKDGDHPQRWSPVSWLLNLGLQPNGWWWTMESGTRRRVAHSGSIHNMESFLDKIPSCRYKTSMDKRSGFRHHPSEEGIQVEGHALWRGQDNCSSPRADQQDIVYSTS